MAAAGSGGRHGAAGSTGRTGSRAERAAGTERAAGRGWQGGQPGGGQPGGGRQYRAAGRSSTGSRAVSLAQQGPYGQQQGPLRAARPVRVRTSTGGTSAADSLRLGGSRTATRVTRVTRAGRSTSGPPAGGTASRAAAAAHTPAPPVAGTAAGTAGTAPVTRPDGYPRASRPTAARPTRRWWPTGGCPPSVTSGPSSSALSRSSRCCRASAGTASSRWPGCGAG